MADIIEQAVGELIVRDSTAAGVASATANFQRLYDVVRYNWWGIQNLGGAFAGIGGAIAAGLGGAVDATIKFDAGLANVQRTADLTGQDVDKMGKALRALALEKPIDIAALSKIAADAGALGIQGVENIKAFTGTIADLVATTNLTEDSAVQLARLGGVLGLQGTDWQRLGSAILYAGVNSAATERDIVNMSVRLSGAAANAHLTASEIVALAATTTSLGSSSQVGATSLQRFFTQVSKAAATGKPSLKEFAHVAGYEGPQAAKQFAAAYNEDAAKALAQFVTGLGRVQGNTLLTNKILNDLGFNGQRGAQTMSQLAAGTRQTVNPMLNLNSSLKLVNDAWLRNQDLSNQANIIYHTTQSQLKMTENAVKDVAIGFGQELLPALNMLLVPIRDIIYGLDALPAPAKDALAVAGALAAGLFLVVGSAIALAPRITLVAGSVMEFGKVLRGLGDSAAVTVAAMRATAASEAEAADITAFSAGRISRAKQEEAVAYYQAWNAAIRENIQRQTNARTDELAAQRSTMLTQARLAQVRVTIATSEAEAALAEATALAAKGEEEAAAAARLRAVAAGQAAAAAERDVALSLDEAAALEAQAAAATAAGRAQLALAAEVAAAEVAETGATAAAYGLGTAIDAMLGPVGIAFAVISALAIAIGILGSSHRKAADDARAQIQADQELTRLIKENGAATSEAIRHYYAENTAFNQAAAAAAHYGYTIKELYNIVTGLAGADATKAYFDDLRSRYEAGDKAAGEAYNKGLDVVRAHNAAAVAASQQAASEKALGAANNAGADDASKNADAQSKLKSAHDAINNAILDMPNAMIAVEQAELQVTAAQKALSEAMNAGAQHAEDVKKAEDDLAQARIDRSKAQAELIAAEKALATARVDAANLVIDAQNNLADDNDHLADTQQKIADLQKKISDEMAGPSVRDITEATNKLVDANLKLLNSQKKVGDAQYMLNYLQAEGASGRDITNAQDALAAAHADVADNTLAAQDAQDNLNKVQAGADPVQLAKDQRDLAAAERELGTVTRKIAEDTAALQTAQDNLANDTLYKDRLDALHEAQLRLDAANYKVIDSTAALKKVQNESPNDQVRQAQVNLEQALLGLAKAHTQVIKDTALMHGEQFGAGREAATLANELGKLGIKASGPVATHLRAMSAVLRQNVSDIKDASTAAGDAFNTPAGSPAIIPKPVFDPGGGPLGETTGKSWMAGFIDWIKHNIRKIALAIVATLAGAIAIVVFGLPALVVVLVAALIAAIVAIVAKYKGDVANAFSDLFSVVGNFFTSTIPDWWHTAISAIGGFASSVGSAVGGFFTSTIPDAMSAFLKYLGGWGSQIGTAVAHGFTGAGSGIKTFFTKTIPGWTGAAITALGHIGTRIGTGIASGIRTAVGALHTFVTRTIPNTVKGIPGMMSSAFVRAYHTLTSAFRGFPGFIKGLFHGLGAVLANLFKAVVDVPIGTWNKAMSYIAGKKISIDFPDWLPGLPDSWGMGFGFFNDLKIPLLASGGIISNPTLAMVGEGHGSEAVVPLDKLFAMFQPVDALAMEVRANSEAIQALAAATMAGGHMAGGDTYNFHEVMTDPVDIMREVTWTKKVRVR